MRFVPATVAAVVATAGLAVATAPEAKAEEYTCRTLIGAINLDNVKVPDGATCTLTGTRIKGNIDIGTNSTVVVRSATVGGSIQSQGHTRVQVLDSRVEGSIQLESGGAADLRRNVVGSDIQLFSNTKAGAKEIYSNTVDGNLQCKSNIPAPVGSGNVVHGNSEDQCRALQPGTTAPAGVSSVTPSRLFDSRTTGRMVPAGGTITVQVTGRAGVPSDAQAAFVNLTAVSPSSTGSLTAFPTGAAAPVSSLLSYSTGENTAAATVVRLGGGKLNVRNNGSRAVHVIVDAQGFSRAASGNGVVTATNPTRVVDARSIDTVGIPAGGARTYQVAGVRGIPSTVSMVAVAVTATGRTTPPTASGWLTGYAAGTAKPSSSTVNFVAGKNRTNVAFLPVRNGQVTFANGSSRAVFPVLDVVGYVSAGTPSAAGNVGAVTPTRLHDTRFSAAIPARGSIRVKVTGVAGAPTGARAALLNITGLNAGTATYLTVHPSGVARPTASNLNVQAGSGAYANLVLAKPGSDGTVTIFNGSDRSVHAIVDITGYVR